MASVWDKIGSGLSKGYKWVLRNPGQALAAYGLVTTGAGFFFPEDSRRITDALRFKDVEKPGVSGVDTHWKSYASPGSQRLGLGTTMQKRAGIFGFTSGPLYDIQKGIGSFIAAPIDMARRFSPWAEKGNVGWDYILGRKGTTWTDLKKAIRHDLGFGDDTEYAGFLNMALGMGGGDGTPGGGPRGTRRERLGHKQYATLGDRNAIERIAQASKPSSVYRNNAAAVMKMAFNDYSLREIQRQLNAGSSLYRTAGSTIPLPTSLRGAISPTRTV